MDSLRILAARATVVFLLTYVLAGCGTPGEPKSAEQAVRERAQERWDALTRNDIAKAYGYLSPGSQAVMDLGSYRSTIRPGFWKSGKVQKVACGSPDACEAHVVIEYEFRGSKIQTPMTESWVRQDGNWWFVQK